VEDFLGEKFYCPHALAGGNQRKSTITIAHSHGIMILLQADNARHNVQMPTVV